jgi:Tfp pilus assembly protein PilZ
MAEKRKARRKIKHLPVTFSSHGLEFTGYTSNLSYTGMFIKTSKPFKAGVPVKVSIHVGKDYTIRLTGLSVRATNYGFVYNKNGMGIQLLSRSEVYSDFVKELFVETVGV